MSFNPRAQEYVNKPAFLSQMQRFINLCETGHHAIRCGENIVSINFGVKVEYEILTNVSSNDLVKRDGNIYHASPSGRVVHFHLVLHYQKKKDGVSAATIQCDPAYKSDLASLEHDVTALLAEVKESPKTDTIVVKRESSPTDATGPSTSNSSLIRNGKRPVDNDLLGQMKSICENAGAMLARETNGANVASKQAGMISGSYAGINFRVSINGVSDGVSDPEELFAVWQLPKNARQRSLPGIRLLVDVLDAAIASNKYLCVLQQSGDIRL